MSSDQINSNWAGISSTRIHSAGRCKRPWGWLLPCVVAACLSGCGDSGPARYRVSGMVTHDGKPVPKGSIMFQPADAKGDGSEYGAADILDGRFDTAAEGGRGVFGGSYTVTVAAFDGSDVDLDMMPDGRPLSNGYRKPVDLPAEDTTLDIELTEQSK